MSKLVFATCLFLLGCLDLLALNLWLGSQMVNTDFSNPVRWSWENPVDHPGLALGGKTGIPTSQDGRVAVASAEKETIPGYVDRNLMAREQELSGGKGLQFVPDRVEEEKPSSISAPWGTESAPSQKDERTPVVTNAQPFEESRSAGGVTKEEAGPTAPQERKDRENFNSTPPLTLPGITLLDKVPSGVDSLEIKGEQVAETLGQVLFPTRKYHLTSRNRSQLAGLYRALPEGDMYEIRLEGHADRRGSPADNLLLSQRRAESVARYLMDLGVDSNRITIMGFGESRPLDAANTLEAWRLNRRVEFIVLRGRRQ
ncbi:MAG: OmpA/MotB domain protein [Magnetococcales bacterium]|nr:OmpA/MotB domain protein [Magnetococcales bacterium]